MENHSKQALLIIDMINDYQFNHGPILAKQAENISHKISSLKKKMKTRGCPIIYVNDNYELWQVDLIKLLLCARTL